jgi:hypothetical protein
MVHTLQVWFTLALSSHFKHRPPTHFKGLQQGANPQFAPISLWQVGGIIGSLGLILTTFSLVSPGLRGLTGCDQLDGAIACCEEDWDFFVTPKAITMATAIIIAPIKRYVDFLNLNIYFSFLKFFFIINNIISF